MLRAPFEPLPVPCHAEDGGEEAELAAIYIVSADGTPVRLGICTGNEFSDHVFERRNYLNLAGSKLRACSIGPELVIGAEFKSAAGEVRIERDGKTVWSKAIESGEENMAHSLANIEHHHFKFEGHRTPGHVHVHFYGAHSLSFGEGVELEDGDWMQVKFEGYGRPLRNPIAICKIKAPTAGSRTSYRLTQDRKGNAVKQTVAILGLGIMGMGMAKNLLKAGFTVHAYNRTRSKAEPLAADGAHVHETPADAARAADIIIAMLSDDNASRAAWTGPQGALASAKPGRY